MKLGLFLPSFCQNYDRVSASIWIRALQMKRYYQKLGLTVSINNFFKKYDVAIFFRGVNNKAYLIIELLRKISKRVYWDQCVNYFEFYDEIDKQQYEMAQKISMVVDGIIVSTDFLKNKAKNLHDNIFLMPDPIDTEKFALVKRPINFNNPKFVWSGVSNKTIFLNKYAEDIDGRIILITDRNIKRVKLNFNFDFISWKFESFECNIIKGDICFAPRGTENFYDLGHSSFKILVFANAGIPIIANKIPSYIKLSKSYQGIEFLEDNNDQIATCIEKLKKKSLEYKKIKKEYSCENAALKMINFFTKELAK